MITEFHLARFADMIHLAWAVPLVLLAAAWGIARRRRILERFGLDTSRHGAWLGSIDRRRWLRATTLAISLAFLTAAAVEPRCNPEKTRFRRRSRDIAVLLDVSKSMLAEDVKPNRLERAKLELDRLSDHLDGDRIGLIAFAGDAILLCPMTSNYSYFKSVLRNVSHRSATQGGTRIGDAVRKALSDLLAVSTPVVAADEGETKPGETVLEREARRQREETYSDILLISDGEDTDSFPLHAAKSAAAANVGIYVVGLGSESGSPIPLRSEDGSVSFVKEADGKEHRSTLDAKTLKEMALTGPRGGFTPAGVDSFDLVEIYRQGIGKEDRRELEETHVSYTEIYQPFLIAGIVFYLLYLLVAERPGRQAAAALGEVPAR